MITEGETETGDDETEVEANEDSIGDLNARNVEQRVFHRFRVKPWTRAAMKIGSSKRREQDWGFVCCILERIRRSNDLKESNRSAVGSAEIRCDRVPTGSNGGHRSAVPELPRGDLKKTG